MGIRQSSEDETIRASAELTLETADFCAIHWFPAHPLLFCEVTELTETTEGAR
jgi:hypothetical protein